MNAQVFRLPPPAHLCGRGDGPGVLPDGDPSCGACRLEAAPPLVPTYKGKLAPSVGALNLERGRAREVLALYDAALHGAGHGTDLEAWVGLVAKLGEALRGLATELDRFEAQI
jgi:hypothetical protein